MKKTVQFPKGPISQITGKAILMKGDDIDTDRIIPARFLKCVSFENLGNQVFADDREELKGLHPFDKRNNQDASILIVNRNFGCGSSREHAPQALMRWGIKAILGLSFAEIFYGNCLSLGIPCAKLSESDLSDVEELIDRENKVNISMDINTKVMTMNQKNWDLLIEDSSRELLMSGGWDGTSKLISQKNKIKEIISKMPYLNEFKNI